MMSGSRKRSAAEALSVDTVVQTFKNLSLLDVIDPGCLLAVPPVGSNEWKHIFARFVILIGLLNDGNLAAKPLVRRTLETKSEMLAKPLLHVMPGMKVRKGMLFYLVDQAPVTLRAIKKPITTNCLVISQPMTLNVFSRVSRAFSREGDLCLESHKEELEDLCMDELISLENLLGYKGIMLDAIHQMASCKRQKHLEKSSNMLAVKPSNGNDDDMLQL